MKLGKLLIKIRSYVGDATQGLPEELFLFATEITPMINVDLLIRDETGRILLSWRNDQFYGQGWHVPGGIIRLKESLEERIQRTALSEIGTQVFHNENSSEIIPIILKNMKQRGHFITLVYECRLPDGFKVLNEGRKESDAGYLKWFEQFPYDMLEVHHVYKKYFKE